MGMMVAPDPAAARAWRRTAWVSGMFCLVLGAVLLAGHLSVKTEDPLRSPRLKELKNQLKLNPTDEAAKEQIRQLDLKLRERYFRQIAQSHSGFYLLIGGAVLFLFAARRASDLQRQPPAVPAKPEEIADSFQGMAAARWAVAGLGLACGAGLLFLGQNPSTAIPIRAADFNKLLSSDLTSPLSNAPVAAASAPAFSQEAYQTNWPWFRGFNGGLAAVTNLPESWDAKTGDGIAWKVPSPIAGFNSPITWGSRIFFSGGDAAKREVVCLDLDSGQQLWRQPVAMEGPAGPALEIPESTGYAAATMATDGQRVYAIFATGELAAFNLDGTPAWSKKLGPLKNTYGHATSLVTWQDRVLVQLDQGEAEEAKSKLYAFNGRTGEIAWQKPRRFGASWASPIAFEAGGKAQVVLLSVPFVTSYAVQDGAELWKVECLGGEVTPSPVFAGGLVIAASPSDRLLGIKPDGQGDVSKTHILWTANDNVPDITSPVSNGELVFTVSSSGQLTCFDAKDGKKQWEHDFEMECHASPSVAGGKVYLFGQKGVAVVVEASRQFKQLFRADLDDEIHASPAFAQGKMILRGNSQIWAIGRKRAS
jgi:outer membrane protein assembly factor BamB